MTKFLFQLCGGILLYSSIFGFALPWLFSARVDIMVSLGLVLIIVTICVTPAIFVYYINLLKKVK